MFLDMWKRSQPKSPYDRKAARILESELATDLVVAAKRKSEELTQFKSLAINKVSALRKNLLENYNVNPRGELGGISFTSKNKQYSVQLSINRQITFGVELEAAKELINEFIDENLKGSNEVIRKIMTSVFKINKAGRLDTAGILKLRDHKFSHPINGNGRWRRYLTRFVETKLQPIFIFSQTILKQVKKPEFILI